MLKTYVRVRLWKDRVVGRVKSVLSGEQGATVSEYALVLALVTVAVIGALTSLGDAIGQKLGSIADTLTSTGQ